MADWLIDGLTAEPEVGKVYKIDHVRKGTFIGRIIEVTGDFAKVERLAGKVGWVSKENNLFNGPEPEVLSIRDSLCTLNSTEVPFTADSN